MCAYSTSLLRPVRNCLVSLNPILIKLTVWGCTWRKFLRKRTVLQHIGATGNTFLSKLFRKAKCCLFILEVYCGILIVCYRVGTLGLLQSYPAFFTRLVLKMGHLSQYEDGLNFLKTFHCNLVLKLIFMGPLPVNGCTHTCSIHSLFIWISCMHHFFY